MTRPTLLLITGPNGAGKTTFAGEFLTREMKGMRFVNADEIARGLSPFDPASVAFKAGRILIEECRDLTERKADFALESTLSGRGHASTIRNAKDAGYQVVLHFLWLASPEESIRRVKQRVKKGGHHVPAADIHRRYPRIMRNLIEVYLPLADRWYFWNSTGPRFIPLANSVNHGIIAVEQYLKEK